MPSHSIRIAAALIATAGVLAALTACAPPIHHVPQPGSFSTSKPKITIAPKTPTPTPALAVKPKPDYSFACTDLMGGRALPSLYSVPMHEEAESKFNRMYKVGEFTDEYYVEVLGGLDCEWDDGLSPSNSSSHQMTLTILPVDSSVWTKFVQSAGDGVSGDTYTDCSSDDGHNTCQYEAYVHGSWYELDTNNIIPSSSTFDVLPPALMGIVSTLNAKLSAGPAAEANGPQKGTRSVPSVAGQLLTAADVKTALALPASANVSIDCNGEYDGPWAIGAEASTELTGGFGCFFDTPDGGTYGGFAVLSGGEWAAKDAIANTPGEVQAVTVNQPVGSALYTWTDSGNDPSADLIDYGNWIFFFLFPPDGSEPASGTAPSLALQNLALSAEKTIGSN
jgi:hypothetical protein